MSESKFKVSSIDLINYGMKGLIAKISTPVASKGVMFVNKDKAERNQPVHKELEDTISWLRDHLLNLFAYTMEPDERQWLKDNVTITGVENTNKGFKIKGELRGADGATIYPLNTPLISSPIQYPEYGDVISIIGAIFTEASLYLEGKKVIEDIDMVVRANKNNPEFSLDAIKNLPRHELKALATKFLEEQCGASVLHFDEEEIEEKSIPADVAVQSAPEPPKKKKKAQEAKMIDLKPMINAGIIEPAESDDFSLDLAAEEKAPDQKFADDDDFSLGFEPVQPKSSKK